MHPFLQDFRYALRMLRKNPGMTLVIVLSLAIGIGANSAVFSVVDALMLRPLPYPQPDRLAAIWLHSPGIGIYRDWPSPGQYIDLQNENHSFEEMSISRISSFTLTGLDQPYRIDGMRTSSGLLHMLGARPLLGRLLLPEEDKPGKAPVAVLSYSIWTRLFNSDPKVIGHTITLSGNPFTVAGVLRPEFRLNTEVMPAEGPGDKMDIFLPFPLGADAAQRRGDENYNLMVKLKPGVTVQQAQADVDIIASRIRQKDKRDRTFGMTVTGLLDQVVGDVRRAMLVLLGSVVLVLLSACANVANLLLTRAAAREKEVAIRTALGAGWQRLARQLLTESVLLSLLGAAAGLALAQAGIYVMRAIHPGNIPRLEDISINGPVLLFTFGVSLVAGLLFGVAPAWRALKLDLNTSLKSGGRSGQTDGGLLVSRHRLRGLLVVSELALSLMLLIGAGLLIRSFVRLQNVPPGFAVDHVLTMQIVANGPKYRDDKVVVQFYREIGERIKHLPGVLTEGLATPLPLTGGVGWGGINVEGYTPPPGQELQVDLRISGGDYFRAMKIPLLKGRYFDNHDTSDGQQVAIIDEQFAQRFWPHDNPVGKHLWFDPKKPYTIAGVVGMVKQYGLDSGSKIVVYFPQQQNPANGGYLVVRTSSDPAELGNAIVREVHTVDPGVPVYDIRTMQERLSDSLARQRFAAAMLGAFAAFALLLAAIGVYGVISYLVTQSTHDIGVRVALGAQPAQILSLVVRQGMALAAVGIAAGLIGAVALTRVMTGLLFGVSATDALTFASVAAILAAVVCAATIVPARRATGVDPMVALREE
ncbi:MAG TPA: ABC transporter permease [Bryobacteraceae bacterium]|jgi:predicted permease|nr:ABC transporter permease [Bryobacteraceae bacterium]